MTIESSITHSEVSVPEPFDYAQDRVVEGLHCMSLGATGMWFDRLTTNGAWAGRQIRAHR
jgi:hypothetical protein